jgi:hypothetical protein
VSWPTLRLTRKRLSAASVTVTSQPSSAGYGLCMCSCVLWVSLSLSRCAYFLVDVEDLSFSLFSSCLRFESQYGDVFFFLKHLLAHLVRVRIVSRFVIGSASLRNLTITLLCSIIVVAVDEVSVVSIPRIKRLFLSLGSTHLFEFVTTATILLLPRLSQNPPYRLLARLLMD